MWWVQSHGWTLYYGDAEAHLDIARRVLDSRTPNYEQIGTVWLPLPHVAMFPFITSDYLWRTGLAGAIPSAAAYILAGLFLFAAARRLFQSLPAALAAVLCFATNPNLLYLQAIPMTESFLAACLMGSFYSMVAYRQTRRPAYAIAAGFASLAATMTRYEGWFLIPFVGSFLLFHAPKRHRILAVGSFLAIASLGPLYWFAHNWYLDGNPLGFYNGPYSAAAIQGDADYPGKQDWAKSWLYLTTTVRLIAGWGLVAIAALGLLASTVLQNAKGSSFFRIAWAPAYLALAPLFYVWSLHSSKTPIFVPILWPNSYYNTRYGLSALPLLAICAGMLVLALPKTARLCGLIAVVLIAHTNFALTWKESEVNSGARRAWTRQAATYLRANYRPGTGILSKLGDLAGVFREAGIPFREILQEGNHPEWETANANPSLFLREEWAIAQQNDTVDQLVTRSHKYRLVNSIRVPNSAPIQIYRRN